jgi:hypothetical protein
MSKNYSEKELREQKKGLLIKMLQRKVEDHIYDHLNTTDFEDMYSLDLWLDKTIMDYFSKCDMIEAYYNR